MTDGGQLGPALVLRAPCKINLRLEVLGACPDGYHEVRTVVQAVDLCDELAFRPVPGGRVAVTCDHPDVPEGEGNLIIRAARLMRERWGGGDGLEIRLTKRVPVGGGLGGGSSDAAVTLLALNELWGVGASTADLSGLAAELGSDVPFFLWGGTALCEGRGERVTPMREAGPGHYVLVMPCVKVATSEVYAVLKNDLTNRMLARNNDVSPVRGDGVEVVARALRNDLQGAALALHGRLREIWQKLEEVSESCKADGMLLSGSGSSFFMVFDGRERALRAAESAELALGIPCVAVRRHPAWDGRCSMLRAGRAIC